MDLTTFLLSDVVEKGSKLSGPQSGRASQPDAQRAKIFSRKASARAWKATRDAKGKKSHLKASLLHQHAARAAHRAGNHTVEAIHNNRANAHFDRSR